MTAEANALSASVRVQRAAFAVDVTIDVAPGETVAVMGPSGAGKSTLLGALAGLVPLDAGEIRIGERIVERAGASSRDLREPPMRRGVVLLGQDPRLFPHLTARENVAFGPRAAGTASPAARALADDLLARVGLPGAGDRRPGELSGGEQQRVAVARALAAAPRAVLLDEPLVALDPETAAAIRDMLRDQLAGVTTVAVTHDAYDAVALADRLWIVERGVVTQSGPVREVLAAPASGFVASIAGLNRVVGVGDGGMWTGEGIRWESADAASRAAAATGRRIAAVFRPGDVRLGSAGTAANAWSDVVTRLEPTPAGVRAHTTRCAVDLALLEAAPLNVGDTLDLTVDAAAIRFLPE